MMLSYVFMGSPPIAATILEDLCAAGRPPIGVVTQPAKQQGRGKQLRPTAVEALAKKASVPCIATSNINVGADFEQLKQWQPDVLLVVAFGQILKKPTLAIPSKYPLNIHASLLPQYRGAAPVQWAIWNGDKETGLTLQKMNERLDAGDVLAVERFAIDEEETSGELLQRMARKGAAFVIRAFDSIAAGKEQWTVQEESKATHARKITKDDAPIDWTLPSDTLLCQIRALQPWPVAETQWEGKRLRIYRARLGEKTAEVPGTFFTDSRTYLQVQCGDGRALSLIEVQPDSRKRMKIEAFLAGHASS